MGQKVHPVCIRVGYIHDWKSNWFNEYRFSDYLVEDIRIRDHITGKLAHAGLSDITIRKDAAEVEVNIHTARPGIVIGKSVDEARAILAHASRDVARDWSKLLESAVANAEHNHELIGDDLRIHAVKADEGPTLKRFRPRAMGRATKIRKRTSHLSITLTPKDGK